MQLLGTLAALGLPATLLAALLPPPDGPYQVSWESQELIDSSRLDPFNSSHPRRLMISRFIPHSSTSCCKICRVRWMSDDVAAIIDANLQKELETVKWPFGELANLEMEVCCERVQGAVEQNEGSDRVFPKILFAPGLNTTRLVYSSVAQHLSSLGYEIIVMDHPYETEVVQFPGGEMIYGGHISQYDASLKAFGLFVRSQDTSFVLDAMDIPSTVYIGHSFGGSAAAYTQLNDSRIAGTINLDGLFEMPVAQLGVPRPLLDMRHDNVSWPLPIALDRGSFVFFTAMSQHRPNIWTKALGITNATHNSFADFGLIGDVITKLRSNEDLQILVGKASGKRMMQVLRLYMGSFLEFVLGRGEQEVLEGPSGNFPDVVFLSIAK